MLLAPLSLCSSTFRNNTSDIHLTPHAQTTLDSSSSQWIWANTTNTVDPVGFRYKWLFSGKFLVDAEMITTAFDTIEFYINGVLMTADNVHPCYASRVCASFVINPVFTVFAIQASFNNATSVDIPAVITKILLTFSDNFQQTLVTDTTWLAMQNPPPTFTQTNYQQQLAPGDTAAGRCNEQPAVGQSEHSQHHGLSYHILR
ncbi:hypothetical protein C8R45DRAFT_1112200 [Mycena sanguinolenta]|nr:hypothetical protein C8R45DRAFT_1112200 [Mycena sanguinolenta]